MTAKLKTCIEEMEMMYEWFESEARNNALYIPEHKAASLIRKIIDNKVNYTKEDFDAIKNILFATDLSDHKDGAQWYDYKIHLNYFLHQYGLTENVF